jgi:hypothetical protein
MDKAIGSQASDGFKFIIRFTSMTRGAQTFANDALLGKGTEIPEVIDWLIGTVNTTTEAVSTS